MAVPEDDMSVVGVGSTMDIEALSSVVLEVSVVSTNPSDLNGVVLGSHWSDDGGNSNSESGSLLVSKDMGSLGPGSDGVGSSPESEPLLVILWFVSSDSESELVSTNVLMPEERSVLLHS